jgi:class 3 adenylate cyclase
VSKKLTELTVQHIIVIILAMIFFFPFLDQPKQLTSGGDLNAEQLNGAVLLHKLADTWNSDGGISKSEFDSNLQTYLSEVQDDLFFIHIKNVNNSVMTQHLPESYVSCHKLLETGSFYRTSRTSEVGTYASIPLYSSTGCAYYCRCSWDSTIGKICDDFVDEDEDFSCVMFDISGKAQLEAYLSFAKTIFVIVVLSTAVFVFSNDAADLVVRPIERMMTLVQKLAENPLGDLKKKKKGEAAVAVEQDGSADETVLLEQTLSKISGLLQVGFGMAGSEVIGKSMSTENDGEFNYMLAGKKITSVFGFAIIEEFTNTCSCLEEETCTYINTIAEIVHQGAHSFHGAPNKNIGCAFLMVWKLCDGVLPGMRDLRDTEAKPVTEEFREWRGKQRQNISWPSKGLGTEVRMIPPQEMVESAVTSFLKVEVDMHHANHGGKLKHFNENPAMVEEFGGNFLVHMGLGLHIGWAIEGTIGSRYKIDASYLSPNVNVAARLEAATHIFGCPLLLSGFLVDELSTPARMLHRKVDVVSVKGSAVPLEIWTFDIVNFPEHVLEPKFNEQGVQQPVDFEQDRDYRHLQEGLDPLFVQLFNEAIQLYVDGKWKESRTSLEKALSINPQDGPSKTLMSVLASKKFVAPNDWQGFRALTSKT